MATEHVTVKVPNWLLSLFPVALVGLLVVVIFAFNPIENLRDVPAVERIAFERTTFEPVVSSCSSGTTAPTPSTSPRY